MNRETWLENAAKELIPLIEEKGFKMPDKVMYSCGFPKGSKEAIGQCWGEVHTKDNTTHIFVCPTQSENVRVLDILLHEMIHAAVGTKEGHKGKFKQLAKDLGLAGKMTATYAEKGTELYDKLEAIGNKIGDYPHSQLERKAGEKRPPGGGWVKFVSKTEPNYILRISPKSLEMGVPKDPWGEEMEPENAS